MPCPRPRGAPGGGCCSRLFFASVMQITTGARTRHENIIGGAYERGNRMNIYYGARHPRCKIACASVFCGSRFNGINFNTTKKKSRGSSGSHGITARLGIFLVLFFFFFCPHPVGRKAPGEYALRLSKHTFMYIHT